MLKVILKALGQSVKNPGIYRKSAFSVNLVTGFTCYAEEKYGMRNRQFQLGFGTQIIIFLCVISNFTLGIYANTHLICSSVIIAANVSLKSVIRPSISKNTGCTVLPVFLDMVVQVVVRY